MNTRDLSILNNSISKARKMLAEPSLRDDERAYWQARLNDLLGDTHTGGHACPICYGTCAGAAGDPA